MAISLSSINPPPSSTVTTVASNAAAPFVSDTKPNPDAQSSAVVTLSAQGQQLNQAVNQAANQTNQLQGNQAQGNQAQAANTTNTAAAENAETRPKETAEAPGIQLVEGESKGGRVNTFA